MRLIRNPVLAFALALACLTPMAFAQAGAPPSPLQRLCTFLCGGPWQAKLPPAQAAKLKVTYIYQLDSLGTVVVGRGVFTPDQGKPWVDMHFYMADPDGSKLRYMGISPKAGMTTGTVTLRPQGFTTIVNQLNVAQLFARIVNDFSVPGRHTMTIYQSDDGFEKPSAIVELVRP